MITLTGQERDRFILYLEQVAESELGLLGEMEKIEVPDVVIRRFKVKALRKLRYPSRIKILTG